MSFQDVRGRLGDAVLSFVEASSRLVACSLQLKRDDLVRGRKGRDVKKQTIGAMAAGALAVVSWAATASAETAVAQPVAQPTGTEQISYGRPNTVLLGGGISIFLASYVPSAIVAVVNDNSYDKHLYVPLVGPWLDLADRPGCGGIGQSGCPTENGYRALLVVVGSFQALGVLAAAVGAAVPERQVTGPPAKAIARPTVHVLPAQVSRDGYGLAAFGNF